MNTITPSVQIMEQRTLRERVSLFLENQVNYCNQSKIHQLESFKNELCQNMSHQGLTDDNLLLGLELNNYLRQINNPESRFEQVMYSVGG